MTLSLILPWFPIVLAVGVGGRLLGRSRGLGLGLSCALFWMVVAQATAGIGLWSHPWTAMSVIAGSVAIVAMGVWAGENSTDQKPVPRKEGNLHPEGSRPATDSVCGDPVIRALDRFDDWLEDSKTDPNPWPRFDEFLRSLLYECCRATHVRPLKLVPESDELVPLREPDALTEVQPIQARNGVIGQVLTTGKSYHAAAAGMPLSVSHSALTEDGGKSVVWCFPISGGTTRLGAVVVGRLDLDFGQNASLLQAFERLVSRFWCVLNDHCIARSAIRNDPVSGLQTRPAFLRVAEDSLVCSYAVGEPVAVLVIGIEGLRDLSDSGRWELADQLITEVGRALRGKVRSDDRLGRFDDSRFILLLRRVDAELAFLIAAQIMGRLTGLCDDRKRWGSAVGARCGFSCGGPVKKELRTLIAQALQQCRRARIENTPIATDAPVAREPMGVMA